MPPFEEQIFISSYIDQESARIDRLIERKGRFLVLLKDKLNAEVISATNFSDLWQPAPFWSLATAKCITGVPSEGLLSVYLDRGVIPYSEGGGLVHK